MQTISSLLLGLLDGNTYQYQPESQPDNDIMIKIKITNNRLVVSGDDKEEFGYLGIVPKDWKIILKENENSC